MPRNAIALALVLITTTGASAADVRVSYLLDARALKSAAAGTPLTFQLFSDAECTAEVASQFVNIEAVDLLESLKAMKVQGGPKPPKTARLQHVMTGVTPEPALYLTIMGAGVVPIGDVCQLQNASVGGSEPPSLPTCPPDSVRVGSVCVDKYEASVWSIPPEETLLIENVKSGTATLGELMTGGATQVAPSPGNADFACVFADYYGPAFPTSGAYTEPLYVASVPGVLPSTCLTAYQAEVACELVGKRLLKSDEWIAAATTTPDTDVDDGITDCNTGVGVADNSPVNSGSRLACVSDEGAFDMIGNVNEWAAGPLDAAAGHGGGWFHSTSAGPLLVWGGPALYRHSALGFRCGR